MINVIDAFQGFVSYIKSISMMKDKKVFDVSKIDTAKYAR